VTRKVDGPTAVSTSYLSKPRPSTRDDVNSGDVRSDFQAQTRSNHAWAKLALHRGCQPSSLHGWSRSWLRPR
jgi:hypothetical protein